MVLRIVLLELIRRGFDFFTVYMASRAASKRDAQEEGDPSLHRPKPDEQRKIDGVDQAEMRKKMRATRRLF